MADETKNETTEEKAPEAPEAEAKAEEAPVEEASAEEAPADDAPADDSPADDAPADDAPAADADGAAAEDEFEGMTWKARQRLLRSRESGEAGPQRTPEDRAAERAQRRGAAAKARASYRKKRRKDREPKAGGTPAAERVSAASKERRGTVVSNKANKTITVRIDTARRHPAYEKIVRESSTLHAHDESNEAGEGDLVLIVETRPLSKTKRWRLVEILEKAK